MSGGHFNYDQYKIGYIADEIEQLIADNDSQELDEWGCCKGRNYPAEVIARFREAIPVLRMAEAYAHEIDWLVCCDTGDDSFLRRLKEKLKPWTADTAGLPPEA